MEDEDEVEEDLSTPSILTVSSNCNGGHCGCYYTNCNKCCRCKQTQIDRTLIYREVEYTERPFKKNESKRRHFEWQQ